MPANGVIVLWMVSCGRAVSLMTQVKEKTVVDAMTARQVIDRIKNQLGTTWIESPRDVFSAGKPDVVVTGIATSYSPSLEVLQQVVAAGKNMLITQQPAFYQDNPEPLKNDRTYLYKRDFIERSRLVLWRFHDNWNTRDVDGQLLGLARSLGWEEFQIHGSNARHSRFRKGDRFFRLPESSLGAITETIRSKLGIQGIRVIGNPNTVIKKATLSNGMFRFSEMLEILKDPEVDLMVVAEAIEWESCEYFRDLLTWRGENKGLVLLGRAVSEDPGYGEVALWLRGFLPEVPIEWIPAHEPFWVPCPEYH